MAREVIVSVYLFVFRILFSSFKLFPQKEKTVGVASFGDNIFYATRSLRNISNEEIVILKDKSCRYDFDESISDVVMFDLKHPIDYLKSIYHLATASNVLVDTYYGFLAAVNFRHGTTCIQLWHAAGAIKQFGLLDPSNEHRNEKAIDRFKQVYRRFDYTVVGSEAMANTFNKSFGLTNDRILRTGIPRTDILINNKEKQRIYQELKRSFPIIARKKVLLYAPTYRNEELSAYQLNLDIEKLYHELSEEYVLFIKLHPAISNKLREFYSDFIYDVSDFDDTNDLLLISDLLITDYSSIPFEYALLRKPMIFYAYDMDEYKVTSGLIEDYENQMPGPVVTSTDAIIQVIKEDDFDRNQINAFAAEWNEYSDGNSSIRLARFLTGTEEEEKEREEALI
ncbi:CDP-glycerol glycerophosphotransferase family protein [Virgibacillus sp. NKC19-3]|uniref:CDP-glycerol glycerophosphotransferase family protein n=1 Tax=Virgibacillus saliphilus TaxID=2831674 RepID=UPI001C9AC834|nr:CDP-glycerol glycerophosphotransferase family protein [Virgibacillus sp. NKC19-3]MBY7144669.1 CDP-glycerol glycerophosphotransferase family protein [Virgibacillus sp. NKC19-3]